MAKVEAATDIRGVVIWSDLITPEIGSIVWTVTVAEDCHGISPITAVVPRIRVIFVEFEWLWIVTVWSVDSTTEVEVSQSGAWPSVKSLSGESGRYMHEALPTIVAPLVLLELVFERLTSPVVLFEELTSPIRLFELLAM